MTSVFVLALLVACNEGKSDGKMALASSSGNINNLSVVIDNDLWEGSIGDAVRANLGAPVYGLPQDEPLFTLRQMPTSIFTGFTRKNRTVLKIEKGSAADTKIFDNPYARPQKMAIISGMTNIEIIEQIEANAAQITAVFKNEEIKEKQRRISKSLHKNNNIENAFGITLSFPSAYRVAKEETGFTWLRRDIKTGTLNLMIYELPIDAISDSDQAINEVIAIRDSIGQVYIPGPLEGSYMITEEAYTPFLGKTSLDDKPALETRSTWEIKKAFMAGPFLNYAIKDIPNNRLLVIEGFAFAPSVAKRDYMFELESIIKSVKFN